jgi:hypothetical protein
MPIEQQEGGPTKSAEAEPTVAREPASPGIDPQHPWTHDRMLGLFREAAEQAASIGPNTPHVGAQDTRRIDAKEL